ncbi:MAG: PilZ domain-containing protein [Myxococcaceae bacterium]|jgi:hypothetical protein|nr:PilZ domain-containing protein [Myxococcaceae bacterium]
MATTPRAVRFRCDLHGRLGGGALKVRVLELSERGAFVEEPPETAELQVGDEGRLTLSLPGGAPWTCRFRVVHLGTARRELNVAGLQHVTVSVRGFGVEFDHDDEDELERLRDFLELLELR